MANSLKGGLEQNVLTLLCFNTLYALPLTLKLRPTIFSTRIYRDIADAAFGHIERYSEAPREHLYDLLEKKLQRGDEGKLMNSTLLDMRELDAVMQPQFVVDQLDKFIRLRTISEAVETAANALHDEDPEKAAQALQIPWQPTANNGDAIWLHKPEQMLAFLDNREEDYFPSGIEVFDVRGVRPARKTLFLILASAKRGKSWWLMEMGKQALLHQKKVLHVTLENSAKLTAKRYIMALYGMSTSKTKSLQKAVFKYDADGALSIDREALPADVIDESKRGDLSTKLKVLGRRARLMIKEFPTGMLTTNMLTAYLDALERTEQFKPDLLIVDYGDLMAIDGQNVRTDTGRVFKELRGIGVQRDLAVITATQGNRSASDAKQVKANMVAEDWSKIATADTICTYSQTMEEKEIGLARVMVAAARDSEDAVAALISQSYATGQFCLDSTFMNGDAHKELKRLTSGDSDGI